MLRHKKNKKGQGRGEGEEDKVESTHLLHGCLLKAHDREGEKRRDIQ